jgi:hypothetical protein
VRRWCYDMLFLPLCWYKQRKKKWTPDMNN